MSWLEKRANLEGKFAAVIGGGTGIGAGVSLALASSGVDVAFCDVRADAVPRAEAAIRALGRRVLARVADATDPAALEAFYRDVGRESERLDIVVNVVGGVRQRAFMDSTRELCATDIQRNYGYVLDSVHQAVPLMRRGGRGGSIVNFTTIEAFRGAAGFAVYAGAKAALTNFSRTLAVELAADRIRVNCVVPDTTPSDGNANALMPEITAMAAAARPEWLGEAMKMYIPLGSPPAVEDLADAVVFLASDLSRSVTGTSLHVDGGTWAASGFVRWPFGQGYLPVPFEPTLKRLFGESAPG